MTALSQSAKAAIDALSTQHLRAIVRENDRKRRYGVPVPAVEQAEADHARAVMAARGAG